MLAALLLSFLACSGAPARAQAVSHRVAAQVYALPQEELTRLVAALPPYADDHAGRPVVAVNLVFAGSTDTLRAALRCGGWYEVGASIWGDFKQGLSEVARGQPLEHFPPFSTFYVGKRPQELSEARATSWVSRHHFRVWRASARDSMGRELMPAAGDYDASVRWSRVDHVADPAIDNERAFIEASLRRCPQVERLSLVASPNLPARGAAGKTHFVTDRRVLVVELRP